MTALRLAARERRALGIIALLGGIACGKGSGSAALDAGGVGTVAVPSGTLVVAALRDPDAAWSRLQHGAGGPLALLPTTLGGLASAALGLDPDLAALVDGHAASYVVVVQRAPDAGGDGAGWAAAIPLTRDGARRLAAMPASALPQGLVEHTAGGMRILTRRATPLPAALAIADAWIVVARDERDLLDVGRYVTETLPADASLASRATLAARMSHEALVGPVATSLESAWASAGSWLREQERAERERHGGRQADFADPEAIVDALAAAVQPRLASIAAAHEIRIEADCGSDDLTVDLLAVMGMGAPDAGAVGDPSVAMNDASASIAGDALPLADVPADTPLALLMRDDADERAGAARDLAATLVRILGSRAGDGDARAIETALGDWAQARGDWIAVGLSRDAEGFWMRAPAQAEAAARALREVLSLARLPPIRAPLEHWLRRQPPVFGPPGATPSTAMFLPTPGEHGRPVGVAWSTNVGMLTISAGVRPLERLVEATTPGSKWSDDARTARVLAALGDSTTFAALAQPLRFGTVQSASAPLAFAWGRRGADRSARIDIADELIAAGVRLSADR